MFNNVTLIGLLLFAVLIVVVFTKKMYFSIAYAIFPILACFALGYNIPETVEMFKTNVVNTMGGLLLIIAFAMTFFRTLTATGFFDVIAYHVVKLTKGKSMLIYFGTFLLALVGGLSASVSSCYFLVFGAFSSVYKKLELDLKKLLFLGGMGCAATGAVPWHSMMLQAAGIVEVDPASVYQKSLPIMGLLIVAGIVMCVLFATQDKKTENTENAEHVLADMKHPREAENKPMYRLKFFWINLVLFLVTFGVAIGVKAVPAWVVFFVFSFLALVINYPKDKECRAIFNEIGPVFFQLVVVFLPINLFVGVITNTGIIKNFVEIAMAFIPTVLASNLHIVIMIIMVPLCQIIPYQFLMSITPFVAGLLTANGVDPVYAAVIVCCPLWLSTSASPVVATTYLGTGLAETDIDSFKKFAMPKYFIICIALVVVSVVFGLLS